MENYNSLGKVIWFTGLSGAGKTTLSNNLKLKLEKDGIPVIQLDGDLLRESVHRDLGFSQNDRKENVRRTAEMAKMLAEQNYCVIVSLITPIEAFRQMIKNDIVNSVDCHIVYVKASFQTCQLRDVKGLYEKEKAGLIKNFTGTKSPFEEPLKPDLVLSTEESTIDQCTQQLMNQFFVAC
ncbi:adenylyl-sulfate kinase [Rhizosphaericola mali]|uniref:Adenylyl-sulfate kinase n=1 Tax=Rhizosphaericola mali TaxID=2545455 RepID=A0A5P2G7F8_9BACT|nr:adenylyl-sulfate kinase [Rhizosphaericola mali]QES90209.1 adenylyl-sulfate kinase [Rhizosphaericola mali]